MGYTPHSVSEIPLFFEKNTRIAPLHVIRGLVKLMNLDKEKMRPRRPIRWEKTEDFIGHQRQAFRVNCRFLRTRTRKE